MMTTPVLTAVPMTMPTTLPLIPPTVLEPSAMLSPSDVRRAYSILSALLCRRDRGEPDGPAERGAGEHQRRDPTTNGRCKEILVHDFVLEAA
jgi:hypothetical protein